MYFSLEKLTWPLQNQKEEEQKSQAQLAQTSTIEVTKSKVV